MTGLVSATSVDALPSSVSFTQVGSGADSWRLALTATEDLDGVASGHEVTGLSEA